jgi:hypothetical protein
MVLKDSNWRSFLVAGGLAAWVQAIGAVIAIAFANTAYSSWKSQEVSKKNAELALAIFRNASALCTCLQKSRYTQIVFYNQINPDDDYLAKVLDGASSRKIDCAVEENAVAQDIVLSDAMLSPQLSKGLADLLFEQLRMDSAVQKLSRLAEARKSNFGKTELWKQHVLEALKDSGVALANTNTESDRTMLDNPQLDKLIKQRSEIGAEIVKFLKYQ